MKQLAWIGGYLLLPLVSIFLSIGFSTEPAQQVQTEVFDSLLAPCCWHESLAVHRSETAANLRTEIAAMAASGMTAQQIREKMTQRYGVRILREPPAQQARFLYATLIAAVLIGLFIVVYFVRRHLQHRPPAVALPQGVTLPDIDLD